MVLTFVFLNSISYAKENYFEGFAIDYNIQYVSRGVYGHAVRQGGGGMSHRCTVTHV